MLHRTRIRFLTTCATWLLATLCWLQFHDSSLHAQQESHAQGDGWKTDGFVTTRFQIEGTGDRNNPLRKELTSPVSDDQLFVRFRIRYNAKDVDLPTEDDGEFFVLWLDDEEGNDSSTHSAGIPNLGIHVSENQNRFMVRYNAGNEKFATELEGDREFRIVGRLWKSKAGKDEPFDQLDLWVDPTVEQELSPHASVSSARSISTVNWIGFSTGRKTELGDRIQIWDVDVASNWHRILGLKDADTAGEDIHVVEPVRTVAFESDVLPLLEANCFECHAGSNAESGIRLDVLDEVINFTQPGDAGSSRLVEVVREGEMPPEGTAIDEVELDVLTRWIDEGLEWNEIILPTPTPSSSHWAFQPIVRPPIPTVSNQDWVRTEVDAFVANRHEKLGLHPAPEAEPHVLRRRMSLDLTGLPPDPEADSLSLDELLSSYAYGERWARHWLDVARWAESNGHQHNRLRPHAWRYRDWVIKSFTSGKPFDDFLREQLSGDEMENGQDDHLIATGFLAAARYSGNELDKSIQRQDILADIVNTTANAFLGLTFECAQCHTHKFDPISIRDYYRFQAFFVGGQPGNVVLSNDVSNANELIRERWQIFDAVHERLVTVRRRRGHPEPIYVTPTSVVGGMNADEKARFDELERKIASLPQAWGFYAPSTAGIERTVAPHQMRWPLPRLDPGTLVPKSRLLIRGDANSLGPEVEPGWPSLFGATPNLLPQPRSALADWFVSPDNPLTARVWVNRIWQWHFGSGIVANAADFGAQGSKPSHPQLLDFLASELIENEWDTNHIHRLIVESSTYRQSSHFDAHNASIDPDNVLLWRWRPRRLEAEAIRDSLLSVAGHLEATIGGPSVDVASRRRGIYVQQRRDQLSYQHLLFDGATANTSCARRRVSTTSLQPLWLLNDELPRDAAKALANRAGSIERAFLLAFGREPKDSEIELLSGLHEAHGLESVCLAILNSSEFIYIP